MFGIEHLMPERKRKEVPQRLKAMRTARPAGVISTYLFFWTLYLFPLSYLSSHGELC